MNFKKFSVILAVSILVVLSFSTAFADDSLYPVGEWYYQLEFNDPSKQGTDAFGTDSSPEGTFPIVETFDGEGVAAFDPGRYTTARCGFQFNINGDHYKQLISDFESGEEVCFEYRAYFASTTYFYKQFFNTMFLSNYDGNILYFDGYKNNIGDILTKNGLKDDKNFDTGWHTFSVVFSKKDGNVSVKNLIVDDMKVPESSIVLGDRATTNGIFSVNKTFTALLSQPYSDQKMYLDYMRIYTVKSLKNKSTDFNTEAFSLENNTLDMTFNYPLDNSSASTAVQIVDESGNPVDIESSVGSKPEVLSITLNEPLSYSNWYNIIITNLAESADNIKYSGNVEFYTENEPLYHFENLNLSAKSIDVKSVLPKEQTLYFVTQIYNADGKLIEADLSDAAIISKEESVDFKTVSIMKKDMPSGAAKAKIFVFDGDLKNIFTMLESDI